MLYEVITGGVANAPLPANRQGIHDYLRRALRGYFRLDELERHGRGKGGKHAGLYRNNFV